MPGALHFEIAERYYSQVSYWTFEVHPPIPPWTRQRIGVGASFRNLHSLANPFKILYVHRSQADVEQPPMRFKHQWIAFPALLSCGGPSRLCSVMEYVINELGNCDMT